MTEITPHLNNLIDSVYYGMAFVGALVILFFVFMILLTIKDFFVSLYFKFIIWLPRKCNNCDKMITGFYYQSNKEVRCFICSDCLSKLRREHITGAIKNDSR